MSTPPTLFMGYSTLYLYLNISGRESATTFCGC